MRLDEVLDTIRDNLRREQKTVMELNCVPRLPMPMSQNSAVELDWVLLVTLAGWLIARRPRSALNLSSWGYATVRQPRARAPAALTCW